MAARSALDVDPKTILDFIFLCGRLKTTKRTGWVNHRVDKPESIADHMYRMGVMAMLFDGDASIDRTRCIKMALVHDMAESIVGDITPDDPVTPEEKYRLEEAAMARIRDEMLGSSAVGAEMYALWREYEECATAEAQVVKDLDKFDMIVQAFEYERDQNRAGTLEDFFKSTRGRFKHPAVQRWVERLEATRAQNAADKSAPS
eukprot:Opistho-1_new@59120